MRQMLSGHIAERQLTQTCNAPVAIVRTHYARMNELLSEGTEKCKHRKSVGLVCMCIIVTFANTKVNTIYEWVSSSKCGIAGGLDRAGE